ncbi:MAG: hypothetical protein RID09_15030 [Coleofasciculus sp. G1-WW12-02]|uniref:hypothetical protein n=1 Tax=Coleofasciculus sp. G1-WW12-02 TaxID=3068483 RepID=UPI0032FE8FE4
MIVSDLARDRTSEGCVVKTLSDTLLNQLTPPEVNRLQDKFWQEAVKPSNGARSQDIPHL